MIEVMQAPPGSSMTTSLLTAPEVMLCTFPLSWFLALMRMLSPWFSAMLRSVPPATAAKAILSFAA
jgi:hypothetical protein